MKYPKVVRFAALAASALTGLAGAGAASATILEVGGVPKNESISITMSLKPGSTLSLKETLGVTLDTCTSSHIKETTASPYTGTAVTGPIEELTFTNCNHAVTVDTKGKLYIEHISGTTNGQVYSEEAEWTWFLAQFNEFLNCKTGQGTLLGSLTGIGSGHAELDINASLTCVRQSEAHITAKWEGTYSVTTPTGLGVSASATTLEVGGAAKNEAVTITSSLKSGATLTLRDTVFLDINTCTSSHVGGKTTTFTGTPEGPIEELSFAGCSHELTILNKGKLYVEHLAGTTNGQVFSKEAEVRTFSTALNENLTCRTSNGTLLGTLTGKAKSTEHAEMDINASLTCVRSNGNHVSMKWEGTYIVTSPTGLGVVA